MRDPLEAIAKAMGKIICRIDRPLVFSPMVLLLEHPVHRKIPHLGIAALNVLLHAQECRLRLVFAISHVPKLLQVGLNILIRILAAISRPGSAFFSTALQFYIGLVAVADVSLSQLDEPFRKLV